MSSRARPLASMFPTTSSRIRASPWTARIPTAPVSAPIYKLDGNHYVPGKDPAHLGGDVWTADAAIEIMNRESWSGLFLTFGAIDKIGHMLGEQDGHGLQSVPTRISPRGRAAHRGRTTRPCARGAPGPRA